MGAETGLLEGWHRGCGGKRRLSWWCGRVWMVWLLQVVGAGWVSEAQARVYATHLRLEKRPEGAGGGVAIRYILNEPATAGVEIEVWDGSQVVRTLTVKAGDPGALRGENEVIWDGRDAAGTPVCCGSYRVRITAAAQGFQDWAQISDDFAPGQYVYAPTGIAVVRDSASPYYGRVLVANGLPGPNAEFLPGDRPGILKFHADGSEVEEGSWSDAGRSWLGDGASPAELEVAAGDRVYVLDRTRQELLVMDPTAAAASVRQAWGANQRPATGAVMTGFAVGEGPAGPGLWMAQSAVASGPGVYLWVLNPGGTAMAGDQGRLVVRAGAGSDLTVAPWDVAVGPGGGLFVIQSRTAAGDAAPRVVAFPAWTNQAAPLEQGLWAMGSGLDLLRGATSVAVDPTGRYVAVAFRGAVSGGFFVGGRVIVLDAVTGAWVTTLPGADQQYTDVDWDAVGNLYVANLSESVWRVYSPPGSNAATTVSVAAVDLGEGSPRPYLQVLRFEGGGLVLMVSGRPQMVYEIEASSDLSTWLVVGTVTVGEAGRQEVTVPISGPRRFYRARSGP